MKLLIIGGAGFIGSNLANYFLDKGEEVVIFDNFSRFGALANIRWLTQKYKLPLRVIGGDIRTEYKKLLQLANQVEVIFHLAGQVAVTTSVVNPGEDFESNALGTFNVLEAVRNSSTQPILIFSSTNKVYGRMEDVEIEEINSRYQYKNLPQGVSEDRILDFHSPYGCSKGAADQYVRDYGRIYGLKTVVFRQSCIYGYRQFGIEDQGWVAWFTIAALLGKPITIYGDGKQVRDVLFIDDLTNAYQMALDNIDKTAAQIYNIGGGPENQLSLLELISYLEDFFDIKIEYSFADWRPGDQPVFVCDVSKAKRDFCWEPKVSVEKGVQKLAQWVKENKFLFKHLFNQQFK